MTDKLRVGVDVGGTNTDAAVLCGKVMVGWSKVTTSADVTTGVSQAITTALGKLKPGYSDKKVHQVSIGTTHFVNAVTERRSLARVAIVRLCGPASHSLPPLSDFPDDLRDVVYGTHFMVNGGYEFNGEPITEIDPDEIKECARQIRRKKLKHIVVAGIFSPVNPQQEKDVGDILHEFSDEFSITLSHKVGYMGMLERENAAVLNEALKPLCQETVQGFRRALLNDVGLECPFYLTQNDGTLISSDDCLDYPVRTFASGPTNSMRGAAFLSGKKNAIVIDIGGTTTDIGALRKGFPREASNKVQVGGVNTNFRMPDVLSIGLGGGSIIRERDKHLMRETLCITTPMKVGPVSVGYNLRKEAIVFGGHEVTATDVAAAAGLVKNVGDWQRAKNLIPPMIVDGAMREINDMLERAIDSVKISSQDQPVILVGGGSILVDERRPLAGVSELIKPKYFQVANAVGAALSQIGGCVDQVFCYELLPRDEALAAAKKAAMEMAVSAGAHPDTVQIVEVVETPLAYVLHEAVRVQVKAVGDVKGGATILEEDDDVICMSPRTPGPSKSDVDEEGEEAAILTNFDFGFTTSPVIPDHKFDISATTGEWVLDERDVECICTGAGILGCGGGGSPYLARLRALRLLRQGKRIRIIDPSRLGTTPALDGLTAMVGFMGAPTVITEKLISGTEVSGAVRLVQKIIAADLDKSNVKVIDCGGYKQLECDNFDDLKPANNNRIVAIMCGEIGGLNAAEPLAVAAEMDLPVVDCDGMGRAFPELQMVYPFMSGHVNAYPATLVDEKNTRYAVVHCNGPKDLENFFRMSLMEMGCKGGLCMGVMTPGQVKNHSIEHSYSRAWQIGDAVLRARDLKLSPTAVILKSVQGKRLIHGKIIDVNRKTQAGFVRGELVILGYGRFQGCSLRIMFQNENLVARFLTSGVDVPEVVACTPDLISVLDSDTGEPITTEDLRYGMRVVVIAMASSPKLRSNKCLKIVGPEYFGYDDVKFEPLCEYVQFRTIAPVYTSPR